MLVRNKEEKTRTDFIRFGRDPEDKKMSDSDQQIKITPHRLLRVILKEELIAITGNPYAAIILGQMMYWAERVSDYDKFIDEENQRQQLSLNPEPSISRTNGWIYKTAKDLAAETMMGMSHNSVRKYIKQLVSSGFLNERCNPQHKWDHTKQYRVSLYNISLELSKRGYPLDGYQFIDRCAEFAHRSANLEHRSANLEHRSAEFESRSAELESRSTKICGTIPEITTETTTETTAERERKVKKESLAPTTEKTPPLSPDTCLTQNSSQNNQGSDERENITTLTETDNHPCIVAVDNVSVGAPPTCDSIPLSPQEMVELWNSTCGLSGLPKILRLTKQRSDNVRRRIKEYGHDPVFWEGLFQRIAQTPFLMG